MKSVSPKILRDLILDGSELAILDAREEGEYGRAHMFWAVNLPYSQREVKVPRLLPCKAARIVCVDNGRGDAANLAAYLDSVGYVDVALLEGGLPAWTEAGYMVFSGTNVLSKAFGEWVEHHFGTEGIDPVEFVEWMRGGRDMVVLDSRTIEEFQARSLPGGISVPGGELVYRIGDIAPNPVTAIVVYCGGRTRGILGAESLRRAGVPNKVVTLRNGVGGWLLDGHSILKGRDQRYNPGIPRSVDVAQQRAQEFANKSGVRALDLPGLMRLQKDAKRSLYLLDVRSPEEFAAGHYPGSLGAPGGQLVQAVDNWIGVRNCRIVLFDSDGVRARMTGAWLRHMGYPEVYVVELTETGPGGLVPLRHPDLPILPSGVTAITPAEAAREMPPVIDISLSTEFRARHIPWAQWCLRRDLPVEAGRIARSSGAVLTSTDGVLAAYAVGDLPDELRSSLRVLEGGTAAWVEAGLPIAADKAIPPDEHCHDRYLTPYELNHGFEKAQRAYLDWEIDLAETLQQDGTVRFGV